jgi:hypothetical protein
VQGREVSDYRSAHTSLLEEVLQPALARARRRYEDLMLQAADSPGATLGQRLYAHAGANLTAAEAAAALATTAELVEALEARPADAATAERVEKFIADWTG